jgi:hypothetical protein
MFNAPIGENTWENAKVIKIRRNVAGKDSFMLNTPVTEGNEALVGRLMSLHMTMKVQSLRPSKQKTQR